MCTWPRRGRSGETGLGEVGQCPADPVVEGAGPSAGQPARTPGIGQVVQVGLGFAHRPGGVGTSQSGRQSRAGRKRVWKSGITGCPPFRSARYAPGTGVGWNPRFPAAYPEGCRPNPAEVIAARVVLTPGYNAFRHAVGLVVVP